MFSMFFPIFFENDAATTKTTTKPKNDAKTVQNNPKKIRKMKAQTFQKTCLFMMLWRCYVINELSTPHPADQKKNKKKKEKTKCVSNDRSGHDDQNGYRIIKIGAILEG